MSIIDDNRNRCDGCGEAFPLDHTLGGNTPEGWRDFCEKCAAERGITNCGRCDDLLEYADLDENYLCLTCRTRSAA